MAATVTLTETRLRPASALDLGRVRLWCGRSILAQAALSCIKISYPISHFTQLRTKEILSWLSLSSHRRVYSCLTLMLLCPS